MYFPFCSHECCTAYGHAKGHKQKDKQQPEGVRTPEDNMGLTLRVQCTSCGNEEIIIFSQATRGM